MFNSFNKELTHQSRTFGRVFFLESRYQRRSNGRVLLQLLVCSTILNMQNEYDMSN